MIYVGHSLMQPIIRPRRKLIDAAIGGVMVTAISPLRHLTSLDYPISPAHSNRRRTEQEFLFDKVLSLATQTIRRGLVESRFKALVSAVLTTFVHPRGSR